MDENNEATLEKCESFINDTLKKELGIIEERLQKINSEMSEFFQMKTSLEVLHNKDIFVDGFKTQVDVGCNFFIQARVADPSIMLFDIGLQHYLEFTKTEALIYIGARIKELEGEFELLIQKSAEIKSHIRIMLFHVGELQKINEVPSS